MPPKPHEYRYIEKFGSGKIPMCGCNRHKGKDCGYRFRKEDNGIQNCPECNKDRYCTNPNLVAIHIDHLPTLIKLDR